MSRDDLDLHSAGDAIMRGGHDRDVKRVDERDLGSRGRRQQRDDDYDDRGRDEDRDDFEDDNDFEDEAEYSSNRYDAESDEEADEESDDRDDYEADESDESDDAERRGQSDDDDRLHDVTVDGETFKVSTKELRDGYQRQQDYSRKTTELAQTRRELNAQHGKVAHAYQTRLQQTEGVLIRMVQLIAGDMNSQEMQQLRNSQDPQARETWTYNRQLIQERIDAANGLIQQLKQEQERHGHELTKRQQDELAQTFQHERAQLVRYAPDWDVADKHGVTGSQRTMQALTDSYGFTADEINGVADARMLLVASDAAKWRALQQHKASAKDKRRARNKPPKQARRRSGSELQRQPTQQRKQQRGYQGARAKLKKTGNMRDAGKAISYLVE